MRLHSVLIRLEGNRAVTQHDEAVSPGIIQEISKGYLNATGGVKPDVAERRSYFREFPDGSKAAADVSSRDHLAGVPKRPAVEGRLLPVV